MPFQFPRIQNPINQRQPLAAELPEMAYVCSPAWEGAAMARRCAAEHPKPSPRRFYIPALLPVELLSTAVSSYTQVEPCKYAGQRPVAEDSYGSHTRVMGELGMGLANRM